MPVVEITCGITCAGISYRLNLGGTDMPAKSKAQERYMAAVASGTVKNASLSKEKAKEFLTSTKGLPERVKKHDKTKKSGR